MRSRHRSVTFAREFMIKGLDEPLPAGTYEVMTDEEQILGLTTAGWLRVRTSLRTPALGRDTGIEQYVTIDPEDLARALADDPGGNGQHPT